MSNPEKSLEKFLERWSQRKLAAAEHPGDEAPDTQQIEQPGKQRNAATSSAAAALDRAPSTFDPSSLPPIELINAVSDLRAFLAPGVPVELTRAALRRAWATDPMIRDFVGIAENQWDFAKPDGAPGFGPLNLTSDLRRLVSELCGDRCEAEQGPEDSGQPPLDRAEVAVDATAVPSVDAPGEIQVTSLAGEKQSGTKTDAIKSGSEQPAIRKHGGALPKLDP